MPLRIRKDSQHHAEQQGTHTLQSHNHAHPPGRHLTLHPAVEGIQRSSKEAKQESDQDDHRERVDSIPIVQRVSRVTLT